MPVTYQYRRAAAEIGAQALDEVDRPVPAAGAPDRDGERAAVVLPVGRQPGFDEAPDVVEHGSNLRLFLEESDHRVVQPAQGTKPGVRSEEHTSELQSHSDLVCRLLLEKK